MSTPWIAVALALTPVVASAQSKDKEPPASKPSGILPLPDYTGDVMKRQFLVGDLDGVRSDLAKDGFTAGVDFTQFLQSITQGGRNAGATKYGGNLYYYSNVDFDRMGLIPGGLMQFVAETRYGDSVNNDAGPILPVNLKSFTPLSSPEDETIAFTITKLSYTQFVAPELGFFAGKLIIFEGDQNEFASGAGTRQFFNFNFNFSGGETLVAPYSTLGGGVIVIPTKDVLLTSTIMNTEDASTTTGFGGFGDGWTWNAELSGQTKIDTMPGGALLGVLYAGNNDFADIGEKFTIDPSTGAVIIPTKKSTWAVYANAWQYLLTLDDTSKPIVINDGRADLRGLGIFARGSMADRDVNPMSWTASVGLGGRGLIPSRDDDSFGIAYYYNDVKSTNLTVSLGAESHGQGLEAYYNLAVLRSTELTFDVQWNQSPLPNTDASLALGLRLNIRF